MLVVSVHLKCCGRIGGQEDRTRIVQADAFRDALAAALPPAGALIVTGDLNLVGSRDPLEHLRRGLDREGRALEIADLLQLDGLSNVTWSDARQPFLPGRLDWLLYTRSALDFRGGFVFDSNDLRSKWLEQHGLRHEDSTDASDHYPLVADFSWR
jgi:endonuclease/exonuclease/phosphatase family metal-dependent hydrolase